MAADPLPANDDAPHSPSLFDRAVAAARRPERAHTAASTPRRRASTAIDGPTLMTVIAILAAPLATWGGAAWLAASARADGRVAETRAAPVVAVRDARTAALDTLSRAWSQPSLGTTIESVARVLPPEASLARAERDTGGRLTLDVLTPDPDRLIAALRRDATLGSLRPTAQTAVDGRMQVTLETAR